MCEYRIYDRGPAQREPFDFFTKNFLRRLPFESQWPPFSPSVNDNDATQAVRAMRDIIFRKTTTSIFLSADFISVTAKGL